jgi:hypothetical protein
LPDSEDLKVMSMAKNEYTMDDSSYWLFESLDCSRACCFYCSHLASRNRIDATWSSRLVAWGRVDRDFQKITTKKRKAKGGLNKEFHTFLHERWLQVGTSKNNLAHTFTYFANFGVLTTRCFESATLFKADAVHMLVQYGARDAR